MKRILILLILVLISCKYIIVAQESNHTLQLYHTTDVHGNFFPFDFINNKENTGGLARVSTYMNEERKRHGDNLLLFEGGDLLQGQPSVYYSNFVDTISRHLGATVLNYIGYNAAVMGNHDIETGAPVYNRWVKDCDFPILGANIIAKDGTSYLPPYAVFEKEGIKIAVVGMITQAIPAWLPENLWHGLRFEGIGEASERLLPIIREKEQPDIIVGLFHSGVKNSEVGGFKESVGLEVAHNVPGYDILLCGHDHSPFCDKVVNRTGDSVLIINPASNANLISKITISLQKKDGIISHKQITGQLDNIANLKPDEGYLAHFSDAIQTTHNYVDEEIGEFTHTISAKDAFFGPSAFIDLLHSLQLKITGADISLTAPLSMYASIDSGKVYMRDMFSLYRYENLLYTMTFTGEEIRKAIEFSYGLWCNQMQNPDDHLLLMDINPNNQRYRFVNPSFSFDSAAGIIYTVDVTQPIGKRVHITSMADGTPFDEKKTYRVAVNSYQGSGGGDILTEGAGIDRDQLRERIIFSTDKDLRYYLAEEIKNQKTISPLPLNQWKFIPTEWTTPAAKRDYKLLFK